MIDKDKVIQLAKEAAGVADAVLPTEPDPQVLEWLERFAQAIYRQGLEDAAKEFDRREVMYDGGPNPGWYEPDEPAQIIRSLKESTNGCPSV